MDFRNWHKYYNLLIFDEIDSTNSEAKRLIKSSVSDNFLIWAKSQTSGRGRYGREWVSPEGNLYISILIKANFNINKASELSFLASVSAGEVIANYQDNALFEYKWPNDLMLNGKKTGGIILESNTQGNSKITNFLIIGMGININNFPDIKDVRYDATSLSNEKINLTCEKLLDEFMQNFTYNYHKWEKDGFEHIRKLWLKRAMNFGNVLNIISKNNIVSGIFKDMTLEGNLELSLENGEICIINAGEIF